MVRESTGSLVESELDNDMCKAGGRMGKLVEATCPRWWIEVNQVRNLDRQWV
jgi:hypothetical protein